jgi:hypothetical protein
MARVAKSDKIVLDPEPTYEKKKAATQEELCAALRWYVHHKNEKDAAKYLGCDLKHAKNNSTLAWVTRMLSRGFVLPKGSKASYEELKARYEKEVHASKPSVEIDADGNVVEVKTNVINLQERIAAKTDQHIGELEGMIDEFGFGEKPFNAYDWFIEHEVKPIHANKIGEYFRNRAKAFLAAVESKDKEYRTAHLNIGKTRVKSILSVMASIVKDSERLAQNANKMRKPRKKKAVSAEKLVSKLNFKEKDNTFKIQSINPQTIVGAAQLWVFNTKTRRLALYNASDRGGLSLKGSTLKNFADDLSFSKTLRKPEKVLTSILEGGKIVLRRLMDDINGKSYKLNGRINKDCVILRAVH